MAKKLHNRKTNVKKRVTDAILAAGGIEPDIKKGNSQELPLELWTRIYQLFSANGVTET